MKTVRLINSNFYIKIIALIMVIGCAVSALPTKAYAAACPTNCSAESSANCGKKLDANCIAEQNKNSEGNSCFNNVPVTSADSVSMQCSEQNGESGTNFPVSSSEASSPAQVKSAAKGKVVFADVTEDGGRTVIIEHTKGCEDGSSGTYHTVYRHLLNINVSMGQEIDMNTIIGTVGGSTGTVGGSVCDNKSQSSLEGYRNDGCSSTEADDVHLNFEVIDGPASGSSSSLAGSVSLDSNCAAIQSYCGGAETDLQSCSTENPTPYQEKSVSATNVNYKSKAQASSEASCEAGLNIDSESCVFCDLFKAIYNSASAIAKVANDGLAGPTKNIVGIGFLIWLAIYILRNIASMGAIKTSELFKGVLFQGFRVTVVMLILGGAIYQVMDLTINPILQTGLSFTRTISSSSSTTCESDAEYLQGVVGYDSTKGMQADSPGGLSVQVGVAFICSIKKLEDSVSKLMSYGHYSTCLSFKDFPALGFLPHAGFLTTGAFLFIVGAVLLISFPWFLIDCLLQLCITVALLPCAIGAFAFKVTAKYLKTLWSYFMNAMFNFVFISIAIFIITANFKVWLGYDFNDENIDPNLFLNATGNGLAWWGTSAFRILGVCFFCFMFLSEAKEIAGKFAGAPALGGGKGIGVMFGGLAASTGLSLSKTGLNAGVKMLSAAGDGIGESASSLFGSEADSRSNQAKGMLMGLTGGEKIRDENGNVVGYSNSFNIRGKEYKRTYTKDDKGVWTETIQKGNKETINDTILKTELTKNENGDVVGIKTSAKTVSAKYGMTNKDGTVNNAAVSSLMSNSSDKQMAARHIVSSVMKERGMQLDDTFLSSQTKINDDGTVTITQKNEDGKIQTVNARIDENNKMIIDSEIKDGDQVVQSQTTGAIKQNAEATETPVQSVAAPETGSVGPQYASQEVPVQSVAAPETGSADISNTPYSVQGEDGRATSISANINGKTYTLSEKDFANSNYSVNGQQVTFDMLVNELKNNPSSSMVENAILTKGRDENGRTMSLGERMNYKNAQRRQG